DAPNEKPGAADQHSRSDNPDQQAAVIPDRQPGNPGLDVAVAAAPPEAERDPGDIDHEDEIDTGVAKHSEPAPPASSAGMLGCREPGDCEPARQAGETERDCDQEDRADGMSMAELPRAELDSIARAGRAMGRPDRGNGRRGANEEIYDAARDVAEPAHQRDRLGTGRWRHQTFRGLHDAADSKTLSAQTAPRSAKLRDRRRTRGRI